jgi:coenzyme F420-reducing hydrogenase beta subunit
MFGYALSTSVQEIEEGGKSRYYPVEMARILRDIRKSRIRVAVVGIPCFVKAVRLLCEQDSALNARIAYCIGLVCGHLKSEFFALSHAWQAGIPLDGLRSVDFRRKLPGRRASDYGVAVSGTRNGETLDVVRPRQFFFGADWGLGFFKYKACDFCDDVFAETADVTVGDAWLPRYVSDSAGTSILVVRSPEIHALIRSAAVEGRIQVDALSADGVAASQDASLRHRRSALPYRVEKLRSQGEWVPRKRDFSGSASLLERERRVQDLRMAIAERSRDAFLEALAKNDFEHFRHEMASLVREYEAVARSPWRRGALKIRRFVARWLRI